MVKEHPVFARFYEWLSKSENKAGGLEHRQEVAGKARGRVVEIGAGNGLNFEHYRDADVVVAVEPEPNMIARARPRAASAPTKVLLVRARAEALPFRDGAFDTAVSHLVLCSVTDPGTAVDEIRRVLHSGGHLRFFEHVRSTRPRAARWQDRIDGVWGVFAAGCHANRDTVTTLREGGFQVGFRSLPFGPPSPARPHVTGAARVP